MALLTEVKTRGWLSKPLLSGLLAVFLLGCAESPTAKTPPIKRAEPMKIRGAETTFDCDSATADTVCIVFNGSNCPVYTIYRGVLNAMPEYSRNETKRMKWQAVTLEPPTNPPTPAVYNILSIDYQILFEPFKGNPVKMLQDGFARSRKLGCKNPDGGDDLPPSECLPGGVDFKYTIWTGPNASCDPLDPMFRVN